MAGSTHHMGTEESGPESPGKPARVTEKLPRMEYGLPPTLKCGPAPCSKIEATFGRVHMYRTAQQMSAPNSLLNVLKCSGSRSCKSAVPSFIKSCTHAFEVRSCCCVMPTPTELDATTGDLVTIATYRPMWSPRRNSATTQRNAVQGDAAHARQ